MSTLKIQIGHNRLIEVLQYTNYKYLGRIEFILRILSISCSLNCTTFIKLIAGLLLGEMLCLQLLVYMLLLIYAILQTKVSRNAIYFYSCPHAIAIASGGVAWINIVSCNIQLHIVRCRTTYSLSKRGVVLYSLIRAHLNVFVFHMLFE
jgi:hypothetical protein